MPGTSDSLSSSIVVIVGPAGSISIFTFSVVLTRFAGWPAFSRLADSAIEKHPASAAPISSSGFVPVPLSNRDRNENGPSYDLLPSFIVPLPPFSVPSHTAVPIRSGMCGIISFHRAEVAPAGELDGGNRFTGVLTPSKDQRFDTISPQVWSASRRTLRRRI